MYVIKHSLVDHPPKFHFSDFYGNSNGVSLASSITILEKKTIVKIIFDKFSEKQ